MQQNNLELSLIVPAYNEEKRLGCSLEAMLHGLRRRFTSFEIIVVDDGSKDGTAAIVHSFMARHPEVRLVRYEENRGKGYAVRRGVMMSRGQYVLFSDADLSTPVREIAKLMSAMGTAEVAIGSRAIRESRILQYQPIYRVLMGKTFNKIVQLLVTPGIKDTQCGFKLFQGPVARQIFSCCMLDGFSFDVEALYVARRLGYQVKEVGVVWRNSPESKVNPVTDSIQMFLDVLKIRLHSLRGLYVPASRGELKARI